MSYVFVLLILLQIKHCIVDFFTQTDSMVKGKGIYGNIQGLCHSLQHAVVTFVILLWFVPFPFALLFSMVDFVTHYHIDWVKMKFGCRDVTKAKFWNQLGVDQLAHQLVYILIVFLVVLVLQ